MSLKPSDLIGDEIKKRRPHFTSLYIRVQTLISLAKTPSKPDPIARSFVEAPDYYPHWRFLLCAQYLAEIQSASDPAAALSSILSEEKDAVIKELLAFESGMDTAKETGPIEYALRCHRTRNEKLVATQISAMVIIGRSPSEIADELGTTPENVVAYEEIFFDIRRYLHLRGRLKELCYFPNGMTLLNEGASRWLIAAYERGWDGFACAFLGHPPDAKEPGWGNKKATATSFSAAFTLGWLARLSEFVKTLEMKGVNPTAQEMEVQSKLASLVSEFLPDLYQLNYPRALSPTQRTEARKAAETIAASTPGSRRRITDLLERLGLGPSI